MTPVAFVILKERKQMRRREYDKFQKGGFNGSLRRNFPCAVSNNRRRTVVNS